MTTAAIPEVVRALVARNVPDGTPPGTAVRLVQHGEMRRAPGQRWSPWTGTEELRIGECGFVWEARWRMAPLTTVRITDTLRRGRGSMDGRLWGLVPIVRGGGPAVDRGALIRYLAELMWVPQALAANPELRYRQTDERTVEVSADAPGAPVAVTLDLDEAGDVVRAWTPGRPRDTKAGVVETPWGGLYSRHAVLGGVRIPTRAEVYWDLPEGRFVWWRGAMDALEVV